jgi:hypothetical protein
LNPKSPVTPDENVSFLGAYASLGRLENTQPSSLLHRRLIDNYYRLRDHYGLVLAMLTIALFYLLMIDLKGIWTDEGWRFGIMNGGRLFLAPNSGFTASFAEVLSALNTTNYQPLYFLLMNSLSKITQSHNIILFRMINILFLLCSQFAVLSIIREWRITTKIYAMTIFTVNGYMFMHILQVREYPLGILFLLCVIKLTLMIVDYNEIESPLKFRWLNILYGTTAGLAAINQFWIVPTLGGCVIFIMLYARRKLAAFSGLLVSGISFVVMLSPVYFFTDSSNKIFVGHGNPRFVGYWDPRMNYEHLFSTLTAALGYFVTGSYGTRWYVSLIPELTLSAALLVAVWVAVSRTVLTSAVRELKTTGKVALLCLCILIVLLGFQWCYFFLIDGLASWVRYYFQQFCVLSILVSCAFSFANVRLDSSPVWKPGLVALAAFRSLLIISSIITGVNSVISYRNNPYTDAALSKVCEWRGVTEDIQTFGGRGAKIIFSNPLAAQTVIASGHFLAPIEVWDAPTNADVPAENVALLVNFPSWTAVDIMTAAAKKLNDHGFSLVGRANILQRPIDLCYSGPSGEMLKFERIDGLLYPQ